MDKLQEVWRARVDVFDLSDIDQRKSYADICQAVHDGSARVFDNQVHFDPTKGRFMAFVRWYAVETVLPPGKAVTVL